MKEDEELAAADVGPSAKGSATSATAQQPADLFGDLLPNPGPHPGAVCETCGTPLAMGCTCSAVAS